VLADVRAKIAAEANRTLQATKNDLISADANVVALTVRADKMKAELDTMNGSRAALETLEAQSAAARSIYSAFLNRSEGIDASLLFPSKDVRLISAAAAPTSPAFPQTIYVVPGAAIAALILAGLIGLLAESRHKGVGSSSEIEALFGLPTLGIIPKFQPKLSNMGRDAIENLLNRIYFGLRSKSILITSALPDEGKTTCAKTLAEAAAERGLSVLLVDGDLRSLQSFSGDPNAPRTSGLAEVLRGEISADAAMEAIPGTNLTVLSSGQVRNNPVRLLAQSSDLLHELTARFELVIIDGPPVMVGGDCWILSQHVDHTIMLVKWESTPVKAIRTALKQLTTRVFGDERSASTVAGIVLNMIDPQRSRVLANEDSVMFAPSIYNYHRSGER
jgi:capsular exopolysaccharide synthesis family protein